MLSLIVAMDQQGVIGINNSLPWRLSADLKNFKKVTMGKPIVMGRKTYESIGKPLPGRENIIITRSDDYEVEGCKVFNTLEEMYEYCADVEEVVIIGGAELYKQTFAKVDRIYLTEVHTKVEGDTFFPEFDRSQWREVERKEFEANEKNQYAFSFTVLDRV